MSQSDQNKVIPKLLQQKSNSVLKSRGESPFFGLTDGESNMAVSMKLILENGEQKAIHYHDIVSPIEYDGNSKITLLTPRITIIIEGRNLDDLFDYIIQHRVKWVSEGEETFAIASTNKLGVYQIKFET